jgi:transposase
MKNQENSGCGQCDILAAKVAALQRDLARLREELAASKKNSSTSSKPPSSDIVKPKPPDLPEGQKRSIGGQPGHPMHAREPFPHDQVSSFQTHSLDACPDCGGALRPNGLPRKVVQQVDIQAVPLSIEQHTCLEYVCNHCGNHCQAALPLHIEKGGLVGPDLTALIAFMKGGCHASFSTIRKFLRDIVGVSIARGTLCKIINKVSQALDEPYEELLHLLPHEDRLNIDETGHKDNGKRSEAGRRWSERIWTVIATCARQGHSVYAFLKEAIARWFQDEPAPSLLPQGATT